MSAADDLVGLFDMDGSLADYEGALLQDLELIRSPSEPPTEDVHDESQPHLVQRIRMIKRQPGWWSSLKLMQEGIDVFWVATAMGFNCQILTKGPKRYPKAWEEKVLWCQQHIGTDVDVHVVSDKQLVYGKFLYDDYPDYMLRWLKFRPRGLGIMPVNKHNANFNHIQVIKYNGQNIDEVVAALKTVVVRSPGSPLTLCGK